MLIILTLIIETSNFSPVHFISPLAESEETTSFFSSYLHSLKEISVQLTSLGQVLEEEDDKVLILRL